jgi:iron-sulfur cluster assembly protein
MLTITPIATEAIRVIVQSSDAPEEGGLRISVAPQNDAQAALAISISAAPQEGDAVVDQDGAHVFLDETAASALDDKALDARIQGDQIAFEVVEQAGNGETDGPRTGAAD